MNRIPGSINSLAETILKKESLPRKFGDKIDAILEDFMVEAEIAELSDTLLSVAVAVAKKNIDLKDEEILSKICIHLRFIIQIWVDEQNEGMNGQVIDTELIDKVKKLILKKAKAFGFTDKDITEVFTPTPKNLEIARDKFGKKMSLTINHILDEKKQN